MQLSRSATENRTKSVDLTAILISLVLIMAGASKLQSGIYRIQYVEQSYQELPNVLLGLVEVAWSLWLYTNSRTRPVWKFTFILFMAFFVYGAYTAYLRKPCDCFGDLAVTARWVLLLDAVALASIVSILKLARLSRDLERSIAGPVSFGIFTVFSAIAGNAILYNFSSLSQPVQLAKETVSVTRAIARCWVIWETGRRFVFGPLIDTGQANPLALVSSDGTGTLGLAHSSA